MRAKRGFRLCGGDKGSALDPPRTFCKRFLELQNFTKWVQLPTARRLCRLPNKNTAVFVDASITKTAAFFFVQPHGRVAVGRGVFVPICRGRRSRRPMTYGYRKHQVLCHPERERSAESSATRSRSFARSARFIVLSEQNRRAKSEDFARKGSPISYNGLSKIKVTFNTEKSIRAVWRSRFGRRTKCA